MSASITVDEMEYRSYAVLARTAKISAAVKRPSALKLILLVTFDLARLLVHMRALLEVFHTANASQSLLESPVEELADMCERLQKIHDWVAQIVQSLRAYPRVSALYRRPTDELERCVEELQAHVVSMRDNDALVVVLTKREQRRLERMLLNPAKPTAALRKAFDRYSHV